MDEPIRFRAIVRDGHLVPLEPVSIPDGAEVTLTILTEEPELDLLIPKATGPRRNPAEVMEAISAKINRQGDGRGHVHHDEVLYGWKKTP